MESPLIFWGDTIWQRDDVKSKFLWYLGLQKSILTSLHYHGIPNRCYPKAFYNFYYIKLFGSPLKGYKTIYNIVNIEHVTSFNKSKWKLFLCCQIYSGKLLSTLNVPNYYCWNLKKFTLYFINLYYTYLK